MLGNKSLNAFQLLAILVVSFFTTAINAAAQTEHVLYSFGKTTTSGNQPQAGLVMDGAGNLYGTTLQGGAYNGGTVFELSRTAGGAWTEKTLHSFGNGNDGKAPWASLIFDSPGNLYSTTTSGGAHNGGTVFELSPEAGGLWKETLLHSFGGGKDGSKPEGSLLLDASGNLYGTTYSGGSGDQGTVFELTPLAGGSWSEKILHSFENNGIDGNLPGAGLVLDAAGNLYGTTEWGGTGTGCGPPLGSSGCGTAFELVSKTGEKILHNFNNNGADGANPADNLIFDNSGSLYGTCRNGGSKDVGGVFELTLGSGGEWTETVLYSFLGTGGDGSYPWGGLIFDSAHNLYGTTYTSDAGDGGIAFELTPVSGGWSEIILHSFAGPPDGSFSFATLIFDSAGNLYGTTSLGGTYGRTANGGTVFEIRP